MKRLILSLVVFLLMGLGAVAQSQIKVVDAYGFTGDILKDTCVSGMIYAGNEALFSAINKQQAAYKAAHEAGDWESAATLTPLRWVEAWMCVRDASNLLAGVNPKDGIGNSERTYLLEARGFYEKALAVLDIAKTCCTNTLSEEEVKAQIAACRAKIQSEEPNEEGKTGGLIYIARCLGERPWPTKE